MTIERCYLSTWLDLASLTAWKSKEDKNGSGRYCCFKTSGISAERYCDRIEEDMQHLYVWTLKVPLKKLPTLPTLTIMFTFMSITEHSKLLCEVYLVDHVKGPYWDTIFNKILYWYQLLPKSKVQNPETPKSHAVNSILPNQLSNFISSYQSNSSRPSSQRTKDPSVRCFVGILNAAQQQLSSVKSQATLGRNSHDELGTRLVHVQGPIEIERMSRARDIYSVVLGGWINEIVCQLDLVRVTVTRPETAPGRRGYGDGSLLADGCELAVERRFAAYDEIYARAGAIARVKVAERCEANFADSAMVDWRTGLKGQKFLLSFFL
jgi:hypothetical protein